MSLDKSPEVSFVYCMCKQFLSHHVMLMYKSIEQSVALMTEIHSFR